METRIEYITIMGKSVKVEVKPGHFGPAAYTIFGKESSIFVFKKTDEVWKQAYGIKFTDEIFNATVEALEKFEL